MRILVLGGTGLLGRELIRQWSSGHHVQTLPHAVWDARGNLSTLHAQLVGMQPDVVVNCVGITKAKCSDPVEAIEVNSVFPHRLAKLTKQLGVRLIHISTDCVFSGDRGLYTEADKPDATDLYGRSKLLGEVNDWNCLTVRTSFVGRHPTDKTGLVEWFLAQTGEVKGYYRSRFSGLTTKELARALEHLILSDVKCGIWHVGGPVISKYDLLLLIKKYLNAEATIRPEGHTVICNRSLNSSHFNNSCYYAPTTWEQMILDLIEGDVYIGCYHETNLGVGFPVEYHP